MNSESDQQTTLDRGKAVRAWLAHFEADSAAAVARVGEMKATGVPEAHIGEWLGATLALTPVENRCAHWGDDRNCPQCLGEELDAESEAKKATQAENRLEAELEDKDATIAAQSRGLDAQSAEIKRLQLREQQLVARLASRKPRLRLFGGTDGPK